MSYNVNINHACMYSIYSTLKIPYRTVIYVTGSAKMVLITQDRKFDFFFTQTQSLMNVLSHFTVTVDQSKMVCFCWLPFYSTVAIHTSGLES